MDPLEAIKATFFQECDELLGDLEVGLLALDAGDSDPETVNAVFRAVHSVKGGAGAFGLESLVRFAHAFETTLDGVRNGTIEAEPALLRVMLKAADRLADHVAAAKTGGDLGSGGDAELVQALESFAAPPRAVAPAPAFVFAPLIVSLDAAAQPTPVASVSSGATDVWTVAFRPRPALYRNANDPANLIRELSRLGAVETRLVTDETPTLDDLDPLGACLSWVVRLEAATCEDRIRDVFEFVEGDCELTIALETSAPSGFGSSIDAAASPSSPVPGDPAPVSAAPPAGTAPAADTATTALTEGPTLGLEAILALARSAPEPEPVLAFSPVRPGPEPSSPPRPSTGETTVSAPSPGPGAPACDLRESAALAASPHPHPLPSPAPTPASPPVPAVGADTAAPTIRVDLDRVDRLIDLVGELVINQAMLAQQIHQAGVVRSGAIALGLDDLEQLTREIQDSVMAIRAQPVKSVFQRMPRLVREISGMTGKSVRLITEGEGTEVDKTVIERLSDPLTHMIRNAVDHGLESPEARRVAGKAEQGVIRLSAQHRSGRVIIEVSDDGKGIDRDRVRSIAITRGLIEAEASLSDDEIDNLIFAPGFSTAATVSDLSGRGVGMDVVKRSIQSLGGRITITSRPGQGSTFTLSLPLTLAVLDGMVVSVGDQTLVVPITAIVETLQPKPADVRSLGPHGWVVVIRGEHMPLIDVADALGFRSDASSGAGVTLLVESEPGGLTALRVDAIQGQRQVVIKSLEQNYDQVDGIAAATILGDGRVALILDVDALVARRRAPAHRLPFYAQAS